jgi:hypothetical protein
MNGIKVQHIEEALNNNECIPLVSQENFFEAFNNINKNKNKVTIVFDVSNRYVTSLPKLMSFKYLKTLIIANCFITEVPSLPKTIDYLSIHGSLIETITEFPPNVKTLHLTSNRLINIENIPLSVEKLDVSFNQLVMLPPLNNHENMITLDVSYNKLDALVIPPKLKNLNFCRNNIPFLTINNLLKTTIPKLSPYDMNCNPLIYPQNCILHLSYGYIIYSSKDAIKYTHFILDRLRMRIYLEKYRVKFFKWYLMSKKSMIEKLLSPTKVNEILDDNGEDEDFHNRVEDYIERNLGFISRIRKVIGCKY